MTNTKLEPGATYPENWTVAKLGYTLLNQTSLLILHWDVMACQMV
jgi:hypothetical protein